MLSLITPLATKLFSVLFAFTALIGLQTGSEIRKNTVLPTSQQKPSSLQVASTSLSKTILNSKKQNATTPLIKKSKKNIPETQKSLLGTTTVEKNTSSSTPTAPTPPPDLKTLDETIRHAVVNILCLSQNGGYLRPISGSGVIIDPKGIILTNAHIAQYFLVKDYPSKNFIECIARAGSPATPTYRLELAYLPSQWVYDNTDNITSDDPLGTGENDFALLHITGTIGTVSQKNPYPSLTPNTNTETLSLGQNMELGGYPAGFLDGFTISQSLYMTTTYSTIKDVFTFKTGTLDLMSFGGSILAQKGASGSAVTDLNGTLLGLIVTSTEAPNTKDRDLRAITLAHVNNKIETYTGYSLAQLLSVDPQEIVTAFNASSGPALSKKIISEIEKRYH